eukprot:IDg9311t1
MLYQLSYREDGGSKRWQSYFERREFATRGKQKMRSIARYHAGILAVLSGARLSKTLVTVHDFVCALHLALKFIVPV